MKTELTEQEKEFLALRTFYNSKGKVFFAYNVEDEAMINSIAAKMPELKDKLLKITNKIF